MTAEVEKSMLCEFQLEVVGKSCRVGGATLIRHGEIDPLQAYGPTVWSGREVAAEGMES
jgi:hypothetical protein